MTAFLRLVRPAQWLKNGVVLAAYIFGGHITDFKTGLIALAAAGVFCLLSSAVYVFNDLVDRERDRLHPLKKNRPLASGKISPTSARAFIAGLLAVALVGAWEINTGFFAMASLFLVINVLYSIWLKNLVIFDVMSIAISFVIRAYAGAIAIEYEPTKWLTINTLLLALFLGFGKRRHELLYVENAAAHRSILSKYSPYLLDQLIAVVTPSVVVIYMLWTFSSETSAKLGTENLFVTIPFVVYGIFRYLYLVHQEQQGGSPTQVLISDKPIMITVLLWLITSICVVYVLPR